MATRIGGPVQNGFNPRLKTWGDMRSPIVLNGFQWNASYTEFSRQWPLSPTEPPWTSYKYFKWESGSLFRHDTRRAFEGLPFFYCYYQGESYDPPAPARTWWALGASAFSTYQSVDNSDFLELVGEALDTDVGTFIINGDAHDPALDGQTLTDAPQATEYRQIYGIGKLTGF